MFRPLIYFLRTDSELPGLCSDCVRGIGEWALAINGYKKKSKQRQDIRKVLRREWRPILHALRDTTPLPDVAYGHKLLLDTWGELGQDLGLKEGNADTKAG